MKRLRRVETMRSDLIPFLRNKAVVVRTGLVVEVKGSVYAFSFLMVYIFIAYFRDVWITQRCIFSEFVS